MSTTTGVGAFTECLKNSAKGKKNSAKVWNEYGHCVGYLRPNFSGKKCKLYGLKCKNCQHYQSHQNEQL